MISSSADRVSIHTSAESENRIRRETEARIAWYAQHPDQIDQRLRELDEEWDIERTLQFNSSAITLFGLTMTLLRGRHWLLLPLTVQGFFMQHTLQGWCPPLPIFRKMGVRTDREIATERFALKALRGDFADVGSDNAAQALQAAQMS